MPRKKIRPPYVAVDSINCYKISWGTLWSLYPKETTDQIHVTNFFSFVFSNKHAPWMIFLQLPCNLRARSYSSKQLGNTNWQYVEAHQFKNFLIWVIFILWGLRLGWVSYVLLFYIILEKPGQKLLLEILTNLDRTMKKKIDFKLNN